MSFFDKIKQRKWIIIGIVAVLLVAFFAFGSGNGNGTETIVPTEGDLVRTVSVSGKVIPATDAKLAFETSGIVRAVYKDAGDPVGAGELIVSLDQSEINADLLKARADLEGARAELGKIQSNGDQVEVVNARRALVQSIVDAYTTADDAIHNRADQFFEHPRSPLPDLIPLTDDNDFEDEINDTRYEIELALRRWGDRIPSLTEDSYSETDLKTAQSNMSNILSFLQDVTKALGEAEATDEIPQATLDKWRSDTAAARSNVNTAAADLVAKSNALTGVVSDAPVREANVRAYEASVARLEAELRKTAIRSPIQGIVAVQDAEVGEAVSANTSLVTVISNGYEVEAFVPEVSIAGLVIGNTAAITLDAYGEEEVFPAKVIHIDPAETIRDGVSTYKIRLSFDAADSRIRSGMTANIEVETLRKANTLLVPLRSVLLKEDGTRVVFVKNGEIVERAIEVGDTDSEGNIEVLSGLEGDEAILVEPLVEEEE